MLFNIEKRSSSTDWQESLINDGILPRTNTVSYTGVQALKNSDILTSISYVAGHIARFPIIVTNDKTGEIVDLEDVTYLINKAPSKALDAYHWKFMMVVSAFLANDGISRLIRDPMTGHPAMIQYYPRSQVNIDDTDSAHIKYDIYDDNTGKHLIEDPENIIHFKFFTVDGVHGRSPLNSLKAEVGLQDSGIQTLTKFFKSGLKGGVLKTNNGKLSKESRKKVREDFEYAQEGANAGSPIIIDSTMDYKPLEVDTSILSLIQSNSFTTAQVAKVMHVPSYILGVNSPNQSVKQLNDDFIKSDLPFYTQPIIGELQAKMLTNQERHKYSIKFDTRSETALSIADAKLAVEGQLLSPNEAKYEAGYHKSNNADMDRMQSNLNTVFLDQKEAYQAMKGGDKVDNRYGETSSDDSNQP